MSHAIAWDIETAPLPVESFSERQMRRYDKLWRKDEPHADVPSPETSARVRSLHPMLGFVCAVAGVSIDSDVMGEPWSLAVGSPEGEADLLSAFWLAVQRCQRRPVWVTFNGKRFDCDWLRVRSARHGITPTRRDLLDSYPFKHTPHADLARIFNCTAGLPDLCDHLGVPDPKQEAGMNGADVSAALIAGDLDGIRTYCEADAVATMQCYIKLRNQL
jgi:hypothetical protein